MKLDFLKVVELAALKGLLCVPWLEFFLGITWHQMYTTALQVSTATKLTAIYSVPFLLAFWTATIYEPNTNYLSLIHDPEFSAFPQK